MVKDKNGKKKKSFESVFIQRRCRMTTKTQKDVLLKKKKKDVLLITQLGNTIQIHVRAHVRPSRKALIPRMNQWQVVGKDVMKPEPSYVTAGDVKWSRHFGKRSGRLKKFSVN